MSSGKVTEDRKLEAVNQQEELKVTKESKCPLFNRPKVLKLNRLEEFCAVLVWNG